MNKEFLVCSKRYLQGILLFFILFFLFGMLSLSARDPEIYVLPEPQYMFEGSKIMLEIKHAESNRFRWEFGDGRSITGEAKQNHVYRERGVYRVKAYDQEGKWKKPIEKRLTILKEGREIILENRRYSVGQPVHIKTRKFIQPPTKWDFGDGKIQTAGTTVKHTYQKPGVFTIGAVDYGGRGEKTITRSITISADNRHIEVVGECIAGESVELHLKNAAGGDYQWDLGDGKRAGGLVIREHVFQRPGTATVTVNDRSGQYPPLSRKVTVNTDRRQLRITPPDAIPEEDIRFEAQRFKGPVRWDFGDGVVKSGRKTETHSYKETGRFTVTARDYDGKSPKEFTKTVTVREQAPGFQLTHLEIAFADGKYYSVVARKSPPPAYYVKMKAAGRGIIKGRWQADGQTAGLFQVVLTGSRIVELRGTDVPALPLQDLGIHNFTLEFTNYDFPQADRIPILRYFVSESGAIQIVAPEPGAKVTAADTVALRWKMPLKQKEPIKKGTRYQLILSEIPIQFLTDEKIDALWKPAGRSTDYSMDVTSLKRGAWIYWQVRAIGQDGTVLTTSEISSFKLVK